MGDAFARAVVRQEIGAWRMFCVVVAAQARVGGRGMRGALGGVASGGAEKPRVLVD
jgi:hypothetical protein